LKFAATKKLRTELNLVHDWTWSIGSI
jgi:hypothetical protein